MQFCDINQDGNEELLVASDNGLLELYKTTENHSYEIEWSKNFSSNIIDIQSG